MSRTNRVISLFSLLAYLCGGAFAGATPVYLCLAAEGGVRVEPVEVDCCKPEEPKAKGELCVAAARVTAAAAEHRCPNCVDVRFALDTDQLSTPAGRSSSFETSPLSPLHTAGPLPQVIPPPLDAVRFVIPGSPPPVGMLRAHLDTIVIRC